MSWLSLRINDESKINQRGEACEAAEPLPEGAPADQLIAWIEAIV